MSPSRSPARAYHPPRRRSEVLLAVLGVLVVVSIAAALIWVLAPHDPDLPNFTPPPVTSPTTAPGSPTTTLGTTPG